jgi:hypothetical protein
LLLESCKDHRRKSGIVVATLLGLLLVGIGLTGAALGRSEAHTPAAAGVASPALQRPAAKAVQLKQRRRREARHQPHTAVRATISLYEHTVRRTTLRVQGCSAAKRRVGGIVILDFGQPAYNGHTYGTNLFSGRFAANREITRALVAYSGGYVYCLPHGSGARITLARGTSNYRPQVPNPWKAGYKWARETKKLSQLLHTRGYAAHVTSAAADDVEPAWDRTFHKTRDFFKGYRAYEPGHLLYNFGSLDGGVGSIWNTRQSFFVTGGMRYVRAIPEIYNHAMARQWAYLAHIARKTYKRKVRFAGVMTQHKAGTGWMKPHEAHRTLIRELASIGQNVDVPSTLTNIRAAQ